MNENIFCEDNQNTNDILSKNLLVEMNEEYSKVELKFTDNNFKFGYTNYIELIYPTLE